MNPKMPSAPDGYAAASDTCVEQVAYILLTEKRNTPNRAHVPIILCKFQFH